MKKNHVFKYLLDYKLQAILAPLFKLLEASFELFVPLIVSDIIDNGIVNNDTKYIISKFLVLILLAVIGMICSVTSQYFSARTAVGFSTRLKQVLFEKIQSLDFNNLDREGTSHLINVMTSDINQLQTGVNLTLRLLLRSPFVVLGAMVMAYKINFRIAYIFVITIVVLSIIVFFIMLYTIPLYRKVQQKMDKVLSLTRENLVGTRVLRAFNQEQNQIVKYEEHNTILTKSQQFVGNISGLINPLTFVVINMAIVWLIYSGAIEVNSGTMTQGNVIALYNYMTQILVELIKLANLIIQITKALASKKRIEKVLNIENTLIESGKRLIPESNCDNETIISFENVSMKYPDNKQDSIHNISFTIKKGETVGIIGGTGSGKTTLINLIPHFYDATNGTVKYCGIPVQDIDSELLRDKIGVVSQKATMFMGTIRENMLIGNKNATDEEIVTALKQSQSYDFVFSKPANLDYVIEQEGKNLSGGQRQRLSVARALIKKPEVIILDDSSSALDYKTDMLMRQAINNESGISTKIIVSQRTSSIMGADKILVLDNGNLVGIGTHGQLLSDCEIYKEIYLSQYQEGTNEEK